MSSSRCLNHSKSFEVDACPGFRLLIPKDARVPRGKVQAPYWSLW
jgi:hypothetical protein